ncbi:MAG: hypothetical protein LBT86_03720 [Deltaproteobacteria bacterium]|jgi:hypothetical protein|nr:hypothetical protein [Deltaproteobacteria bacterium]
MTYLNGEKMWAWPNISAPVRGRFCFRSLAIVAMALLLVASFWAIKLVNPELARAGKTFSTLQSQSVTNYLNQRPVAKARLTRWADLARPAKARL